MAVGYKKDLAYIFYATRSGLGTQKFHSLRDHMRAYYVSQVTSSTSALRFSDLERKWLRLVITTNGGTPTGKYISDLWKQAVIIKGLKATNMVEENQVTYWASVTSANGL